MNNRGDNRGTYTFTSSQSESGTISSGMPLLGPRTKDALDSLISAKSFSEVKKSVSILENATKLSRNSCKAFVSAGVHTILYDVMRSCNRSAPHIDLLESILGTLFHVSNHRDLVSKITNDDSVDTLIDLIQMFRDKDEVLNFTTMILKRIVWSDNKYLFRCRRKENMKRILGVYKLLKTERNDNATKPEGTHGKNGIRTLGKILERCIAATL